MPCWTIRCSSPRSSGSSTSGWGGLAVAGTHRVSITTASFTGSGECGLCFLGVADGSLTTASFDGNKVGVAVAEAARPTLMDLTIDGGEVGLQVEGSAAPIVDGATISSSSLPADIVGGKATGALASVVVMPVSVTSATQSVQQLAEALRSLTT